MSSPLPPKSKVDYLSSRGGKYTTWRGQSGKLVGFSIGGPSDELRPFTKDKENRSGLYTCLSFHVSWYISPRILLVKPLSMLGKRCFHSFARKVNWKSCSVRTQGGSRSSSFTERDSSANSASCRYHKNE